MNGTLPGHCRDIHQKGAHVHNTKSEPNGTNIERYRDIRAGKRDKSMTNRDIRCGAQRDIPRARAPTSSAIPNVPGDTPGDKSKDVPLVGTQDSGTLPPLRSGASRVPRRSAALARRTVGSGARSSPHGTGRVNLGLLDRPAALSRADAVDSGGTRGHAGAGHVPVNVPLDARAHLPNAAVRHALFGEPTKRPAYSPREGSVAYGVCEFFANNVDEELLTNDIATKFGTRRELVKSMLSAAVHVGWIARRSSQGVEAVYRAGPRLSEFRP